MNKELFIIEGTIGIRGKIHGRLMFSSARNVPSGEERGETDV